MSEKLLHIFFVFHCFPYRYPTCCAFRKCSVENYRDDGASKMLEKSTSPLVTEAFLKRFCLLRNTGRHATKRVRKTHISLLSRSHQRAVLSDYAALSSSPPQSTKLTTVSSALKSLRNLSHVDPLPGLALLAEMFSASTVCSHLPQPHRQREKLLAGNGPHVQDHVLTRMLDVCLRSLDEMEVLQSTAHAVKRPHQNESQSCSSSSSSLLQQTFHLLDFVFSSSRSIVLPQSRCLLDLCLDDLVVLHAHVTRLACRLDALLVLSELPCACGGGAAQPSSSKNQCNGCACLHARRFRATEWLYDVCSHVNCAVTCTDGTVFRSRAGGRLSPTCRSSIEVWDALFSNSIRCCGASVAHRADRDAVLSSSEQCEFFLKVWQNVRRAILADDPHPLRLRLTSNTADDVKQALEAYPPTALLEVFAGLSRVSDQKESVVNKIDNLIAAYRDACAVEADTWSAVVLPVWSAWRNVAEFWLEILRCSAASNVVARKVELPVPTLLLLGPAPLAAKELVLGLEMPKPQQITVMDVMRVLRHTLSNTTSEQVTTDSSKFSSSASMSSSPPQLLTLMFSPAATWKSTRSMPASERRAITALQLTALLKRDTDLLVPLSREKDGGGADCQRAAEELCVALSSVLSELLRFTDVPLHDFAVVSARYTWLSAPVVKAVLRNCEAVLQRFVEFNTTQAHRTTISTAQVCVSHSLLELIVVRCCALLDALKRIGGNVLQLPEISALAALLERSSVATMSSASVGIAAGGLERAALHRISELWVQSGTTIPPTTHRSPHPGANRTDPLSQKRHEFIENVRKTTDYIATDLSKAWEFDGFHSGTFDSGRQLTPPSFVVSLRRLLVERLLQLLSECAPEVLRASRDALQRVVSLVASASHRQDGDESQQSTLQLTADILLGRDWAAALQAFSNAPIRVQRQCSLHVLRFVTDGHSAPVMHLNRVTALQERPFPAESSVKPRVFSRLLVELLRSASASVFRSAASPLTSHWSSMTQSSSSSSSLQASSSAAQVVLMTQLERIVAVALVSGNWALAVECHAAAGSHASSLSVVASIASRRLVEMLTTASERHRHEITVARVTAKMSYATKRGNWLAALEALSTLLAPSSQCDVPALLLDDNNTTAAADKVATEVPWCVGASWLRALKHCREFMNVSLWNTAVFCAQRAAMENEQKGSTEISFVDLTVPAISKQSLKRNDDADRLSEAICLSSDTSSLPPVTPVSFVARSPASGPLRPPSAFPSELRILRDATLQQTLRAKAANTQRQHEHLLSVREALLVCAQQSDWKTAVQLFQTELLVHNWDDSISMAVSIPVQQSLQTHAPPRAAREAHELVLMACYESRKWDVALSLFNMIIAAHGQPPHPYTVLHGLEAARRAGCWQLAVRVADVGIVQPMLMHHRSAPDTFALVPWPGVRKANAAQTSRNVQLLFEILLDASAAAAAVTVGRQLARMRVRDARLVSAMLEALVQCHMWSEAVSYFYDAVANGVRVRDDAIQLVLVACDEASGQHALFARSVRSLAEALEDLCSVSTAVLEHVELVYRFHLVKVSSSSGSMDASSSEQLWGQLRW